MGLKEREPQKYANIISDGTIRVKTSESDPKAVKREYELKNGQKGVKFERVYQELSGIITGINFYEGDYGKVLLITFQDDEKIVLTVNMQTNYAEDIMKKIPNIDFTKEVTFRPFSFTDDKGKLRKGISVNQGEKKIKSFFHDALNTPINGFPVVSKDMKYDKEDWKIYFIQVKKFLQRFIEENIVGMFADDYVKEERNNDLGNDVPEYNKDIDEEIIKVEGIPF